MILELTRPKVAFFQVFRSSLVKFLIRLRIPNFSLEMTGGRCEQQIDTGSSYTSFHFFHYKNCAVFSIALFIVNLFFVSTSTSMRTVCSMINCLSYTLDVLKKCADIYTHACTI